VSVGISGSKKVDLRSPRPALICVPFKVGNPRDTYLSELRTMSKTNVTWVARVSGTSGDFGVYPDDQADQLFIHKPDGSTVPITKDEFQSFIDRTHVSESMADTRAQLSFQEWTELIIRRHRKLHEEGELKTGALAPVFAELLPKNAMLDIKMIGEREGTH
jgi:hypothetical protein